MPDTLASQVAAGEVVERPASVVRELLDNALDAGATSIEVQIGKGGAGLIRVTDNGAGMTRDDAVMCIERHATSKIKTAEDLVTVSTLGFRGEALPSVASVSRFKLRTCEHGALNGTCVEVDGGRLVEVRDDGCAPGTSVEVRSLFVNVPARRKFLKTENTEFGHIDQQVRLHAIAHPKVAFRLVRDGRVSLDLPATGDQWERVRGLVGDEIAGGLFEMEPFENAGIKVTGVMSRPGVSRPNRRMQWVFLNGRPVENSVLFRAIKEAYRGLVERDGHPLAFLFLELPAGSFDINVHPAKKEVRFQKTGAVERAVYDALVASLENPSGAESGADAIEVAPSKAPAPAKKPASPAVRLTPAPPSAEAPKTARPAPARPAFKLSTESIKPRVTQPEMQPVVDDVVAAANELRNKKTTPVAQAAAGPEEGADDDLDSNAGIPDDFVFLSVLADGYVLYETDEGLALLHVRAARERIVYEQLADEQPEGADESASQRLLLPVTLETEQEEYETIVEVLDELCAVGFEIEEFGARTFKVSSLPAGVKQVNAADVIRQVFATVGDVRRGAVGAPSDGERRKLQVGVARVLAREFELGGGASVDTALDAAGAAQLAERLFGCRMPYCCPQGRPTLVHIGFAELARRFGR
ncbi:DNA mismatch repair endonuclease MutL [Sulfuriroseicoccus oceanibius]|uniref:DNA mismatch repair protein MutL n=1 Tax=Sulfuriroseicoccus oceanibius TaxID=2707525 RepID=A0A6B3LDM5_9BACT|nr:DNA mismatch repair endonuclease MutL [Sulfuriroseicoccus oceanibius]QQL44987.1 DNA mismatch repair endonuclease MutL [Sulfuriroseicoccus oceanibius]